MICGDRKRIDFTLNRFRETLRVAGFNDPGKEARALIEAVTGMTVEQQILHPDADIDAETMTRLNEALSMRLCHISIPQIAGYVWFDGHRFDVNKDTLVPRPETELLVEQAFHYLKKMYSSKNRATTVRIGDDPNHTSKKEHISKQRAAIVLDTFTGSGAIGIALGVRCQKEEMTLDLTLVDTSSKALNVAKKNAERLLTDDSWHIEQADIWPNEKRIFDIITANPPYVKSDDIRHLMPEVSSHEPHLALDGGPDGLHFYRRLAKEGKSYLGHVGVLILEAGAGQADSIISIFASEGWSEIERIRDAAGWERVIVFFKNIE
ncbi:MAG: peptide chain release factor N(5)-glutamine methyltransferase [Clostridiaceae bacterium]|jgi:release factor glutamine methyltransferase|nr:peptide chain release factor N(5)-glutamine methyltransferase [Clostridiaceae bacterium]